MPQALAMTQIITRDPDIMGGVPVFAGTRVPVSFLIEYLEGGDTIDEFLDGFPGVKREQVFAFLERGAELALSEAA